MKAITDSRLFWCGIVFLPCLWPISASANMGVPYIAFFLIWAFWLLLIPVIVIEAIVISRRLALTARIAAGVSITANLVSCFIGAIIMFVNESLFYEAGFNAWYGWPAKIPLFVILIPSYFISVWIEVRVATPGLKDIPHREITKTFYIANLYSYALLAILAVAMTTGPS